MSFFRFGSLIAGICQKIMPYETRIDQMVGKHVAVFQMELFAAKKLQECEFALLWRMDTRPAFIIRRPL